MGDRMGDRERGPMYKTRMCKSFLGQGRCPKGPECGFAHGSGELRSLPGERPRNGGGGDRYGDRGGPRGPRFDDRRDYGRGRGMDDRPYRDGSLDGRRGDRDRDRDMRQSRDKNNFHTPRSRLGSPGSSPNPRYRETPSSPPSRRQTRSRSPARGSFPPESQPRSQRQPRHRSPEPRVEDADEARQKAQAQLREKRQRNQQAQTKAEGLGAELRVGEERRALAEARCVERGRVLEATQRDLQRLVLKVNKTIKTAAHVYHAQDELKKAEGKLKKWVEAMMAEEELDREQQGTLAIQSQEKDFAVDYSEGGSEAAALDAGVESAMPHAGTQEAHQTQEQYPSAEVRDEPDSPNHSTST